MMLVRLVRIFLEIIKNILNPAHLFAKKGEVEKFEIKVKYPLENRLQ